MRSLGLFIGAVVLPGCGGESLPPPPPPHASADVAGLGVFVDPTVPITSADTDCQPAIAAAPADIVGAVQASLGQAGLRAIVDPNAPHDATLKLRAEFSSCGNGNPRPWRAGGVGVWGTVYASLEGQGAIIGTAQADPEVPDELVRGLLASPALAQYAAAHKGGAPAAPAATAAAGAPSPASTPTATVVAPPPLPPSSPALTAGAPQPNAVAVIVGVEKYSHGLPPPTGARSDAEHFASVVRTSLGLSADHIKVALDGDATKGTVESMITWARDNVPASGRIYFYFSGHGAPDASAGTPYIVPSDGDPQFLNQSAIPESDIVANLSKGKAKEVIVLLDSCFSGAGGRSVLPPGARPLVRIKEAPASGNIALLTASSGAEISGPSSDGTGGVFTKYVVQGLGTGAADMDGDGQITLQELSDWVRPRVSREAKRASRDQNPALVVSNSLGPASSVAVEWGLPTK